MDDMGGEKGCKNTRYSPRSFLCLVIVDGVSKVDDAAAVFYYHYVCSVNVESTQGYMDSCDKERKGI
jgi:hypothetical protein